MRIINSLIQWTTPPLNGNKYLILIMSSVYFLNQGGVDT